LAGLAGVALVAGVLVAPGALAGKKKKGPVVPAGPIVGWHQEAGWKAACYFPRDYNEADRTAQAEVRKALMDQWSGVRNDGVSFSTSTIEGVETVLLGKPAAVRSVAQQNLDFCKKYMSGQEGLEAWQSWFGGLKRSLTEGDCKWPPLRYQQHEYLNITEAWHFEGRVCKGDKIKMQISALDYYRVAPNGPWINAEGDTNQRATAEEYPCTIEGCFVGTVVYRFTGEDGSITVAPVGTELEWTAPQHGILHLRVNEPESALMDNVWRKKGSLQDHAAVAFIGLEQ
jgi:hypothetical protein